MKKVDPVVNTDGFPKTSDLHPHQKRIMEMFEAAKPQPGEELAPFVLEPKIPLIVNPRDPLLRIKPDEKVVVCGPNDSPDNGVCIKKSEFDKLCEILKTPSPAVVVRTFSETKAVFEHNGMPVLEVTARFPGRATREQLRAEQEQRDEENRKLISEKIRELFPFHGDSFHDDFGPIRILPMPNHGVRVQHVKERPDNEHTFHFDFEACNLYERFGVPRRQKFVSLEHAEIRREYFKLRITWNLPHEKARKLIVQKHTSKRKHVARIVDLFELPFKNGVRS